MFSRLNHDDQDVEKKYINTDDILLALQNEFSGEKEKLNCYGVKYPNELLFIVYSNSLANGSTFRPSVFLSINIDQRFEESSIINKIINILGQLVEMSLNDFSEVPLGSWCEDEHQSLHFFYKFSRENVELTFKANELLENDISSVN